MSLFLVEWAGGGLPDRDRRGLCRALSVAARRQQHGAVVYLGTAHPDGDRRCLSLFEAPDAATVRRVASAAQAPSARCLEVVDED